MRWESVDDLRVNLKGSGGFEEIRYLVRTRNILFLAQSVNMKNVTPATLFYAKNFMLFFCVRLRVFNGLFHKGFLESGCAKGTRRFGMWHLDKSN